jgi:hypothetical protein
VFFFSEKFHLESSLDLMAPKEHFTHSTPWRSTHTNNESKYSLTQAKLARLRRPKIAYFPSYVDYRPKTNTLILLDMGHTLRGEHAQEK